MKRTLAISLMLHASVAWWFLRASSSPKPSEKIEVEFKEPTRQPTARVAGRAGRHGRSTGYRRHAQPAAPGWTQLKVQGDFGLTHEEAYPRSWTEVDTSGWSSEQWGSGGGGLGGMAFIGLTLPLDELREEIENMLNYPGALARRGIEGTINARLVFAHDSKCDWSRSKVFGAQPFLRVYIFALLKKLCTLETLEHMGFPENQIVDLSFRFFIDDIFVRPDADLRRGRIAGNVIMFTRMHPKMPLEYHIGPIQGTLLYPYVSLDWPWVVEHWESWVEGKDVLRDFRSTE